MLNARFVTCFRDAGEGRRHDAHRDLLTQCVQWLAKQPCTVMSVERDRKRRTIEIATKGLDQLDARLDARQLASVPPRARDTFTLDLAPGTWRVELSGLRRGTLGQRRVIDRTSVLDGWRREPHVIGHHHRSSEMRRVDG